MREMKNLRKGKLEKKFSEILLESIDEALLKLGENTKSTIYFHLKTKFAISRHDIPDRVGDFSDALEQIFGVGAPQIEVLIMKCLNERVKSTYKWVGPKWLVPDLTFIKYVKLMRLCCEETGKIGDVEVVLNAGEQRQQQRT